MGQRPMLTLCRATCPTIRAQRAQRAHALHRALPLAQPCGFAAFALAHGSPRGARFARCQGLLARHKNKLPASQLPFMMHHAYQKPATYHDANAYHGGPASPTV